MQYCLVLFLVAALLTGCSTTRSTQGGAASLESLVSEIELAAKNRDKQKYLSLSCCERLPQHLKKRFQSSVPLFMNNDIESVILSPDNSDPLAELPEFKWNVDFRGQIEMKYKDNQNPVKIPYGYFNGRFFLATSIKANRQF